MKYSRNSDIAMDVYDNSKHMRNANYMKPKLEKLGSVETMTRTYGYGGNHFGWHPWHPPRRDHNNWHDCFSN